MLRSINRRLWGFLSWLDVWFYCAIITPVLKAIGRCASRDGWADHPVSTRMGGWEHLMAGRLGWFADDVIITAGNIGWIELGHAIGLGLGLDNLLDDFDLSGDHGSCPCD